MTSLMHTYAKVEAARTSATDRGYSCVRLGGGWSIFAANKRPQQNLEPEAPGT